MPFPSRQAAIVGVYMTKQARSLGRSVIDLELEAIGGALADAGLSWADIDGISTNDFNSPIGGSDDPHYFWAEQLGQRPIGLMEHGQASGALAKMAVAISAGMCEVAVMTAGGFEPPPSIDAATGGQLNPSRAPLPDKAPMVGEWDYNIFGGSRASFYALWARRYMHEFGATSEDLARVAVIMRHHATLNPASVMGSRGELTVDDVLNSRMICSPLHLYDCALQTEGGWAIVMTTAERAKDLRKKPVYVLGGAEGAYIDRYNNVPNPMFAPEGGAIRRCADRAFAMAGVTRDDIDVAGLYDCFTITVLRDLEECGFCEIGEAAAYVKEGNIELGGKMPVNTHGGLLSHSHQGRPDGMHTIDVVQQLRGGEVEPERQVPNAKIGFSLTQGISIHAGGGVLVMAAD
jgi:acetyl-CoA C-acetyltransferase